MQQSRGSPAAAMEDGSVEAQPRRSRGPAWSWRGRREDPGGLERGRDREGDREKEGGRAYVRVSLAAQEDEGTIEGSGVRARVRKVRWA